MSVSWPEWAMIDYGGWFDLWIDPDFDGCVLSGVRVGPHGVFFDWSHCRYGKWALPAQVLALIASKGGVGKSTLASALAVRAMKDGGKVALIDWEPQGSLTLWWVLRGKPENPRLIRDIDDPAAVVDRLRSQFDWIVIDGPPAGVDEIDRAIDASDFVLIPVRAAIFDVHAVKTAATLCQLADRPFAFVLNAEDPRRKTLSSSAVAHLSKEGPMLAEHVRDRAVYVSALNAGKSGPEHPDKRQAEEARAEIDALWAAVQKRMAKPAKRDGK